MLLKYKRQLWDGESIARQLCGVESPLHVSRHMLYLLYWLVNGITHCNCNDNTEVVVQPADWTSVRYSCLIRAYLLDTMQLLKRKCHGVDEIFAIGWTGSSHFNNFLCSHWWNFGKMITLPYQSRLPWDDITDLWSWDNVYEQYIHACWQRLWALTVWNCLINIVDIYHLALTELWYTIYIIPWYHI